MIPQETCWKKGHRRRVAKVRQTDTGGGLDGYCSVPKSHAHGFGNKLKDVDDKMDVVIKGIKGTAVLLTTR